MLERHGLTVVDSRHIGLYRSLSQMLYSLLVMNRDSFTGRAVHRIALRSGIGRLPVKIDLSDICMVTALKPPRGS
jgi:hypothetical protein